MTAHTPGPWHVDPPPNDIERANAHLIAAAPDMLAALIAMRDADQHDALDAWQLCESAIAKAQGRGDSQ